MLKERHLLGTYVDMLLERKLQLEVILRTVMRRTIKRLCRTQPKTTKLEITELIVRGYPTMLAVIV